MATAGKIKAEYDVTPYDAKPSEILVDIIGLGAGSTTAAGSLACLCEASM